MKISSFSESEYYAAYKSIRNRFRKFDGPSVISLAVEYSKKGETKLENLRYHPWLLMLLIKWVITDDNFSFKGRNPPTHSEFNSIVQPVLDLANKTRSLDEYDSFNLFIRAIGHQQFIYQRGFDAQCFCRQFVLFSDLNDNHKLAKSFRSITGLDVEDFLQISLCLVVAIMSKDREFVEIEWFSSMSIRDKARKLTAYFRQMSLEPNQVRGYLTDHGGGRNSSEFYEQTPLLSKPLLGIEGRYFLYHPAVLSRGLEHAVFDILRSDNASKFMGSFGSIFEKYTEGVLRHSGVEYFTESEVLGLGKTDGNLIDFVALDENAFVLIDAKGVADAQQVMVTHSSQRLRDRTKTSALKAIRQALSVSSWINKQSNIGGTATEGAETFLIVVTYKELLLGNGRAFNGVLPDGELHKVIAEAEGHGNVPLENMYFMSISSFELLCQAANSTGNGIAYYLRAARVADSASKTRKLEFSQHLRDSAPAIRKFNPLHQRFEEEMDKLASMAKR